MSIKNGGELAERQSRRKRLKDFEAVIEKGALSFLQMGEALGRIRKEELYRELGYEGFELYVVERFDMSVRHAERMITAARTVHYLGPIGRKIKNESTARELAVFGSDAQKMGAVLTAVETRFGKVTAERVREVREQLYPETKVIDGELASPAIEADAPRCESCATLLEPMIVIAAQTRCLKCDPDREHFARQRGGPCETCRDDAGAAVAAAAKPFDDKYSSDASVSEDPAGRDLSPLEGPAVADSGRPGTSSPVAPGEEPELATPEPAATVSAADEVEEAPASPDEPSSTDPVLAWMAGWRVFRSAVLALDVDAIRPVFLSYDLDEMGEDWPPMWERLQKLIYP